MHSLQAGSRAATIMMLAASSPLFGQRTVSPIARPPTLSIVEPAVVPPANLTVTPAATSATLSWSAVAGATGYLVERTSAMYGTIQQTPTPITATSFTDGSQQFDPRYIHTYRVSAVFPGGKYAPSSVKYLPPPPSVKHPAYGGGCTTIGWAGFTTTWAAVPEATGYVLRYKMHMDNGWNVTYSVDTAVVVGAAPQSHYVGQKCPGSAPGYFGVSLITEVAIYALFADGSRSAPTLCPTCSPIPWIVNRVSFQ